MKKNNCPSSVVVNITGCNNKVIINDIASLKNKAGKKKKPFKAWLKALAKLIHSVFVNISVLLIEIFTKLG